jgi:hypothetical protein
MNSRHSGVAMDLSRTGALLVLAVLLVFGSAGPASAVEVSRHPDGCRVRASTGKSEAGRDPESRETCARVDNRLPSHHLRPPEKKHERPIDRLRSRGEGRIKATGDKAARRELHEESRPRR